MCLLSRHHPLARRERMTLDDYLGCSHVVVDVSDGRQGHIDRRLEGLGRPRWASLTVPYHATAAASVPSTALVATLPAGLAPRLAGTITVPAPPEIDPVGCSMSRHPRLDEDPPQRWLREHDPVRSGGPLLTS